MEREEKRVLKIMEKASSENHVVMERYMARQQKEAAQAQATLLDTLSDHKQVTSLPPPPFRSLL